MYLSQGLTKYTINKDTDAWRDKTIFSFNKEDVQEITLLGHAELVSASLSPKDTTEIAPILSTLCNLKADGFADTLREFKQEYKIKVSFLSGEKNILYIGEKTDDKYYAKKDDNPCIFLLNSYKVDKFISNK